MVVYCTGSYPTLPPKPSNLDQKCRTVDLDIGLHPGKLGSFISRRKPHTIAIIGASHSAILVLRNLYHLARDEDIQPFKIKWFTRHALRYAEERDGWIFRDNTGLKGEVADWAKEYLEDLAASPVSKYVEKISTTKETQDEDYKTHLADCDYAIYAIGFTPKKTQIVKLKKVIVPTYDDTTGQFLDQDGQKLEGVYGAGIAFPEKVTDPEGNVEHAVGLLQFRRYLKRVVPTWTSV
jgi:alpha-1,3/alpha-1,6-mannosyltransferase